MIFIDTGLRDAYLIRPEKRGDERGFFARAWCQSEFAEQKLETNIVQANMSLSADVGTLRGMHLQVPPAAETKIIRCTAGALYDVIVDLRPASPSYRKWYGVRLDAVKHESLYVPEGFAHGFLTLEPDTEVYYLVSASYSPDSERGVRYDDPVFGIEWPGEIAVVSEKDRTWKDYEPFPELAAL